MIPTWASSAVRQRAAKYLKVLKRELKERTKGVRCIFCLSAQGVLAPGG